MEELQGAIKSSVADTEGTRSFALWEAMQANPALLDTPAALARSSTARAALQVLQMGRGGAPPPGTLLGNDSARPKLLPSQWQQAHLEAGGLEDGETMDGSPTAGGSGGGSSSTDLVVLEARFDALAPSSGGSLDDLLLADTGAASRGGGVTEWGPRPAETSPYDQLLLRCPDDEFALERGELFELFARARADPSYWTSERLAEQYGTKAEWVAVLLETVCPPVLAMVDGEPYGVRAIRTLAQYEAVHAARERPLR